MTRLRRVAVLSMVFWSAGCGDSGTLSGDACDSETAVAATAALPPTFTWAPDCAVGSLAVTTEAGDPMWQVTSDPDADRSSSNRIRSGVVYGVVPEQAHQFADLVPLAKGQTYRVFLRVVDSRGDHTLVGMGVFAVPAE